ncbi:MAG: hypothetical protein ISS87_00420 [Candidatus Pacebacteria bacterium]|nr:hypothetical protein [Candidatus Paceibacterota bacterium]
MNKKALILIFLFFLMGLVVYLTMPEQEENNDDIVFNINSFEECASAGYPVMESYPQKCKVPDGKTFTQYIGNELEKADLIRIDTPRPNQTISSPVIVKGQARGFWFFEGDFPVVLVDWDGLIIAQGIAQAKDEWMTEGFVSFEAKLEFKNPTYKNNGTLILQKDNPSGLPENDDALEIPLFFGSIKNLIENENNLNLIQGSWASI